jgi:hypothetical protein
MFKASEIDQFKAAIQSVYVYPLKLNVDEMDKHAPNVPIGTIAEIIDSYIANLEKNITIFEDELRNLIGQQGRNPSRSFDFDDLYRGSWDDKAEKAREYNESFSMNHSKSSSIESKRNIIQKYKKAIDVLRERNAIYTNNQQPTQPQNGPKY